MLFYILKLYANIKIKHYYSSNLCSVSISNANYKITNLSLLSFLWKDSLKLFSTLPNVSSAGRDILLCRVWAGRAILQTQLHSYAYPLKSPPILLSRMKTLLWKVTLLHANKRNLFSFWMYTIIFKLTQNFNFITINI